MFAGKCDNETTECITGKCIEKRHDTRNHRLALQQSHNFPIGRHYQGLNNVSKTLTVKNRTVIDCLNRTLRRHAMTKK